VAGAVPLDDAHLIACVRTVELNPVRARLVVTPESWVWSSAMAHVAGRADALVAATLPPPLDAVGPWPAFLAGGRSRPHPAPSNHRPSAW
jgi:putative transposase